jgi:NAD(P)H-hydrate epimerase
VWTGKYVAARENVSHPEKSVLICVCFSARVSPDNGGDGLVAARHLVLFGYDVAVTYPPKPKTELYQRLLQSLRESKVPISEHLPEKLGQCRKLPKLSTISASCWLASVFHPSADFSMIVDAMFGFSFNPKDGIREPYNTIIHVSEETRRCARESCRDMWRERWWLYWSRGLIQALLLHQSTIPLVSIDVPSGWPVDGSSESSSAVDAAKMLQPQLLISLTAPKECARRFTGPHHILGGRFLSAPLLERFGLKLPRYEGARQIVDISRKKLLQGADTQQKKAWIAIVSSLWRRLLWVDIRKIKLKDERGCRSGIFRFPTRACRARPGASIDRELARASRANACDCIWILFKGPSHMSDIRSIKNLTTCSRQSIDPRALRKLHIPRSLLAFLLAPLGAYSTHTDRSIRSAVKSHCSTLLLAGSNDPWQWYAPLA